MLDHTKPYVEKIHYIGAELAEHAHKLDVKQRSFEWLSLFAACMLAKPYHCGGLEMAPHVNK